MKIINIPMISSTSITPSFNSAAVDSSQMLYISAQVVSSAGASPVYSVKLQASNDIAQAGAQPGAFTPTNWSDIPLATVSITANGAYLIPSTQIAYRWIRAAVTFTSGTGNTVVNLFGICV